MENPKNLATQGTQDEEKQSKNNPEKLATQGTQDEEKQNKNNPEKLATYGAQKEKQHEHICAGHNYMHTNTNIVNKTWLITFCWTDRK